VIDTFAGLRHPHILEFIPFVDGELLRDQLTLEKQLAVADTIPVGTEVGGALDYAYPCCVVHGDIKPETSSSPATRIW
jgi:serine/threonine protein kinase